MIEQGVNGISRGCLVRLLSHFMPLHQTVFDRNPRLEGWIRSWCTGATQADQFITLSPEGWFERGHDIVGRDKNSNGVWMPHYENGELFLDASTRSS